MKNPELVTLAAANILAGRARHGYDPKAPELVTEAVDCAQAIVEEVSRRVEAADAAAEAAASPAAAPVPPDAATQPPAP